MNQKYSFNIDPTTLNATFTFDNKTGQIIPKVIAEEIDNFTKNLLAEAEQIKEYPDASMFFPVDESDYRDKGFN